MTLDRLINNLTKNGYLIILHIMLQFWTHCLFHIALNFYFVSQISISIFFSENTTLFRKSGISVTTFSNILLLLICINSFCHSVPGQYTCSGKSYKLTASPSETCTSLVISKGFSCPFQGMNVLCALPICPIKVGWNLDSTNCWSSPQYWISNCKLWVGCSSLQYRILVSC